jgi:exonuclease III
MKIISWNIAHRKEAWNELVGSDADIALLQEAVAPPSDLARDVDVEDLPWVTASNGNLPWRTCVARLSHTVDIDRIKTVPYEEVRPGVLGVSRMGSLSAAAVKTPELDPVTLVSAYAAWEHPHASGNRNWIYADASAHRLLSDVASLIGRQRGHRIIVSGDFNILYGYGENRSRYWAARYQTVFDRMQAMGLKFIGPQAPNGRQAHPWPSELPSHSKNVPTFHSNQHTPESATRQLDFVFASRSLAEDVTVKALNDPEEWGPSDHCRVVIEIE